MLEQRWLKGKNEGYQKVRIKVVNRIEYTLFRGQNKD